MKTIWQSELRTVHGGECANYVMVYEFEDDEELEVAREIENSPHRHADWEEFTGLYTPFEVGVGERYESYEFKLYEPFLIVLVMVSRNV